MKKIILLSTLVLAGVLLGSGAAAAQTSQSTFDLNGEWRLYYGEQDPAAPQNPEELGRSAFKSIPARVPGNVEIDLMKAGILPDISHGTNVYLLRPYETYEWWYHRRFETPKIEKSQKLELVFKGLDCIADVWVNGRKAGHADNMLIDQRFDVTPFLKAERGERTARADSIAGAGRTEIRSLPLPVFPGRKLGKPHGPEGSPWLRLGHHAPPPQRRDLAGRVPGKG